jgi:hypothetical protein
MLRSRRILAIASLFASVSWACSEKKDGGPTASDAGGAAGESTNGGGTSGVGGSASHAGASDTAGAGSGGSESGFWCDLSQADVCRCRAGQKPNAVATTSCPSSSCCVRTGADDNRSCACSKPDSLFTCEDVKNYVGGAIVVASCPF